MGLINNLNFIAILRDRLEDEVKLVLTEELVKKEMESYEAKLRETIKPLVEAVTFSSIEKTREMMFLREELKVYIEWKENDE